MKSITNKPSVNSEKSQDITLDSLKYRDIIKHCALIGMSYKRMLALIEHRVDGDTYRHIVAQLSDPASELSSIYNNAEAEGEFYLLNTLHNNLETAEKDAYKNLEAYHRKMAINQALKKNFHIGEEE